MKPTTQQKKHLKGKKIDSSWIASCLLSGILPTAEWKLFPRRLKTLSLHEERVSFFPFLRSAPFSWQDRKLLLFTAIYSCSTQNPLAHFHVKGKEILKRKEMIVRKTCERAHPYSKAHTTLRCVYVFIRPQKWKVVSKSHGGTYSIWRPKSILRMSVAPDTKIFEKLP